MRKGLLAGVFIYRKPLARCNRKPTVFLQWVDGVPPESISAFSAHNFRGCLAMLYGCVQVNTWIGFHAKGIFGLGNKV